MQVPSRWLPDQVPCIAKFIKPTVAKFIDPEVAIVRKQTPHIVIVVGFTALSRLL